MENLFKALPKLLKQLEDNEKVREAVVFASWKKIAGKSLSRHTVPVCLNEKQLIVAVSDDTWKKHLESLAGQMIFKLNSILGQAVVTYIEFRVDEKTLFEQQRSSDPKGLSDSQLKKLAIAEVTPRLRKSADSIDDKDLREQFLLAAGSCLVRKKRIGIK